MKMYFKLDYIVSVILFLLSFLSTSQGLRECSPGIECSKNLRSCPEVMKLLKSGNFNEFRKRVCGFVGGETKVCCPLDQESLLPLKCGLPEYPATKSPARVGAYPWMAALFYSDNFSNPRETEPSFGCGGSIINSKYVLTAAHCLDPIELRRKKLSVIHVGDYNIASGRDCVETRLGLRCLMPHIVAGVEETITHPMYNRRASTSDDIALIRLNVTLNFENDSVIIEPVCLPPKNFIFRAPRYGDLVAAGWGKTPHGDISDILLSVKVTVANDTLCKKRYRKRFVSNQLCIEGQDDSYETCRGDSGGPLMVNHQYGPPFFQVGIVSFGTSPCGQNEFPGVYTNVADYRDWIVNNLRP